MLGYSKTLYTSFAGLFFHRIRLKRLLQIAHTIDGGKVLEIGCMDLLFYHRLNKKYVKYVGIDLNWHALALAQTSKNRLGWRNVELVKGNAEILPFSAESFDLIFAFETVEHINDEEAAISEITRVLKPGGTLVISVPIEFGLALLLKALARVILRRRRRYSFHELITAAILCRPGKIERDEHKGYDYRDTVKHLRKFHINLVKLYRYPFKWLPDKLNGGIIALFSKPLSN